MVTLAVLLILSTVFEMNPEYGVIGTKVIFDVLRVAIAGKANPEVKTVLDIILDSLCFSCEVRVGRKLVAGLG